MILYGEYQVPMTVYERALLSIREDSNGHWLWTGAKCGRRDIPQIACKVDRGGERLSKTLSVAKLLFIAHNHYCPYQVRRDRSKCTEKLCTNPAHFYAIETKPEPRRRGNRRDRVSKLPGKIDVNIPLPKKEGDHDYA